MNDFRDNPILTAYALDQLEDPAARAEIETLIKKNPDAQAEVDAIRETASLIGTALLSEPAPRLTSNQRAEIESQASGASTGSASKNPRSSAPKTGPHRLLRFRVILPSALAAVFALVIGVSIFVPTLSRSRYVSSGVNRSITPSPPAGSASQAPKPRASSAPASDDEFGLRYAFADRVAGVGAAQESVAIGGDKPRSDDLMTQEEAHVVLGRASRASGMGGAYEPNDIEADALAAATEDFNRNRAEFEEREDGDAPPARRSRPFVNDSGLTAVSGLTADELLDHLRQSTPNTYETVEENPFHRVLNQPLSTFSIDVDTASYANARRFLQQGMLPPPRAVRIEEFINYFTYNDPPPTDGRPFSVNVETAECPWNADHLLTRVALKGMEFPAEQRPEANLIFLIDVSGSMKSNGKLPLVKQSLKMLVDHLNPDDSVGIVVYAGASGLVLPPTFADHTDDIYDAIENLNAGGSTNGGAGIQLAYDVATEHFVEGGVNRVILATDGDFNVGITDREALTQLISDKAKSGVFLTCLGFGMGHFNDATLETIADKGNGNYAYINSLRESEKVLVEQIGATLHTIAKDVKIQVEFNPAAVSAYRLIGYENRKLAARDFNDDTKDAGEIGAGHSVTALYEVVPFGVELETAGADDAPEVDPLTYQHEDDEVDPAVATIDDSELMTVKLRYKLPADDVSSLIEAPIANSVTTWHETSDDFALSTAVAAFGMMLRQSQYIPEFTYEDLLDMAENAIGEPPDDHRLELITLIETAVELNAAAEAQAASDDVESP